MAPPENPFPVSQLARQVQFHTVDLKERSRKLGDFDLQRDCELLELVQYSCTTPEQQYQQAIHRPSGTARMECYPFVRLFRQCHHRGQVFHVETTAWEGEHAWHGPAGGAAAPSSAATATAIENKPTVTWPLWDSIVNFTEGYWRRK